MRLSTFRQGIIVHLLFFSVLFCLLAQFVWALDGVLPPEQAFRVAVMREGDTVRVQYRSAEGYYLYRHRFSFEHFPTAHAAPNVLTAQLPKGETKQDVFFGQVEIYRGAIWATMLAPPEGTLLLTWQGCADVGVCYPPQTLRVSLATLPTSLPSSVVNEQKTGGSLDFFAQASTGSFPELPKFTADWGRVGVLLGFFVAGVLMSLTACMYPMLPIVSAIIAGEQRLTRWRGASLAFAYVQGMALCYALIGVVAGATGQLFTLWLQSTWVIWGSAFVLCVFALAMFDVLSFQMPVRVQSYFSARSQQFKGGRLMSVVFMGFFSALILGPCVAPPMALALGYIGSTGDAALGALALYVMALGLGMPLMVMGGLGGEFLPRAGAWMVGVRLFLGVLMLVIALRLIEPLILPSLHVLLWGILFLSIAVYLGRFLRRSGYSWVHHMRNVLALICLLIGTAQLIGALGGAHEAWQPLSIFRAEQVNRQSRAVIFDASGSGNAVFNRAHVQTINSQADFLRVVNASQPSLVLFSADWCVSCRVIERELARPEVQAELAGVVMVKVDLTDYAPWQRELLSAHQLFGPPALLGFVGGRERFRLLGEFSAQELLLKIQSINKK